MRAAGTQSRAQSHGVSDLLQHTGDVYGPSHASFTQWKHSGFPTASSSTTAKAFGMATTRGGTDTKTVLYGEAAPAGPAGPDAAVERVPRHRQPTVNPITWSNASPEKPRRRPDLDEERARMEARAGMRPLHSGMPTTVPTSPSTMDAQALQQTWGQLVRTGKAPLSVATSLVIMPPEFGAELPGRKAEPALTSVNAIGIAPPHAGVHAHHPRCQEFSKTFSDPFG